MLDRGRKCWGEPRCLLRQQFIEMESVAHALGWEQDFRQLEPGTLRIEVWTIGHTACHATRIQFSRSFHQLGAPLRNFWYFGLPDADVNKLRISGVDIAPAPMVNLSGGRNLDVTSYGPFSGTILSFSPALLETTGETLGSQPLSPQQLGHIPYWQLDNDQAARLRELIRIVFATSVDGEYGDYLREHQEVFDFDLAVEVLNIISDPQPSIGETSSTRHKALRRALQVLEHSDTPHLSVADLCKASSASLSTLNRAFLEEFGVAPKAYMRARRLAGVQRALVNARTGTTVTNIANQWGFWHMSMFAADYKKQFGELPSETLKRSGFSL